METERPLFVDPVDPFFNEVESQIDENKAQQLAPKNKFEKVETLATEDGVTFAQTEIRVKKEVVEFNKKKQFIKKEKDVSCQDGSGSTHLHHESSKEKNNNQSVSSLKRKVFKNQ